MNKIIIITTPYLHTKHISDTSGVLNNNIVNNNLNVPETHLLHALFSNQAIKDPDKISIRFEGEALTYSELDVASNLLAQQLIAQGIKHCIVGVMMERCCELVIALIAVLKTGSSYLPVDYNDPGNRKKMIFEEAQPGCILTQEKWLTQIDVTGCSLLEIDPLSLFLLPEKKLLFPAITGEDLAYIIYTSGSTGRPKGVMISHLSVCNRLLWMRDYLQMDETDIILQKTPYTFDVSVWELFLPLITGATLVVAKPGSHFDTKYISAIIKDEKVTTLHFVPSMLGHYLEDTSPQSNTSIRRVICSGEVLPATLVNIFFRKLNCRLYNFYGPTEATIDVTAFECIKNVPMQSVPIGVPIANTKIYVLDASLEPVKESEVGELFIAGVCLAKGYLKNSTLTEEKFIPNHIAPGFSDRLYRTGDLAYLLPDGNIALVGRLDDQLKLRGHRIEPAEIETYINSYRGVRRSVVVAHEKPETAPYLVAFIEMDTAINELSRLMRTFLEKHLPAYMIPLYYVVVDKLPLTTSGKTDRRRLQETSIPIAGLKNFHDPRYNKMAEIWQSLLGGIDFGIHSNFFACGGHSLIALRLTSLVRSVYNIDVGIKSVFDFPTIAAFVDNVVERQNNTKHLLNFSIPSPGSKDCYPLTFAQEGLAFLSYLDPDNTAYHIPITLLITGDIKFEQIKQTIEILLKRHPALRTSINVSNGEFYQKTHEDISCEVNYSEAFLEKEINSPVVQYFLKDLVRQRFDISHAPLMRATLFKFSKNKYLLFAMFHHIQSDAWSLRLFFQEFQLIFAGLRQQKEIKLPDIVCTFNDYALWAREQDIMKNNDHALLYWEKELKGSVRKIPIGNSSQPLIKKGSNIYQFTSRISKKCWDEITTAARSQETTPFIWLFTVFNVLLARLSGEEDITVGVPLSGRNHTHLEQVFGYFVNTLPIRINLSGEPTFAATLNHVQHKVLSAFDHQSASLQKIIEEINPLRSKEEIPLYNCIFNFYEEIIHECVVDDVHFKINKTPEVDPKVDLKLVIISASDHATCIWEFKKQIFKRKDQSTIPHQFQILLKQTLPDPFECIYDYSLDIPHYTKNLL